MMTHTPDLEARPVASDMAEISRQFAAIPHLSLRRYDGNQLREEMRLPLMESNRAGFGGAQWLCTAQVQPVADGMQTFDVEVTFTVTQGSAAEMGVAVGVDFTDWSRDNYVLLPGAVYRGNDFAVANVPYPPVWTDPARFLADMPTTITDLPRLSDDSPRIEQTTGDVSTPGMGFHAAARRQGVLILTEQATRFGNSGLTVEATGSRSGCRFLVTAPCVREFRQAHCGAVPSSDRAADWRAGDEVTIRLRLCFFDAPRLQDLFDQLAEMRKGLNPSVRREELPFSAAWKMLESKYHRDNWVESAGYFKMAPNANTTSELADDPLCFLWQLGWVGGGMATLPLLFQGTELSRARAWRNLEMIFDRTQAPSGFFYGIGDGTNFFSDGFDRPFPNGMHMIRKSADWLFYALKHFDLLRKQGREVPAPWLAAIRKLADAFVRLWRAEGQFGQFVNVETGNLLVGGSCAAAIAPAGLAMAAEFFSDHGYLEIAEAAAQRYCRDYVHAGLSTGGPGEILSAPDSESAFALLESLVKLHEVTGSDRWLEEAGNLARQAATWVVSYDYQFPPGSDLDRSGAHTTGAVLANAQNKHAAPAICTHSGDALFRLWRATGDPLALDLISDIAHGIPQYMSREDRPLNEIMQPGWICERVNLSDWEGAEAVGGNHFGSTWPEVSLMLTTIEIPGLYVQPETGFYHAFDHIEVLSISCVEGNLVLKLSNPTRFDATVKVLCESSSERCQPLQLNALLRAREIVIPAGESVVEEFAKPFQCP